MADVRDWAAFARGRWEWSRFGYEQGFPRGCGFTDIDAAVEFDGHNLVIEPKHYDGLGPLPELPTGQVAFLRNEVRLGKVVLVLFGCGPCNDPHAVRELATQRSGDVFHDWRGVDKQDRRQRFKRLIDAAMGLIEAANAVDVEKPLADPWSDIKVAKPGGGIPYNTRGGAA